MATFVIRGVRNVGNCQWSWLVLVRAEDGIEHITRWVFNNWCNAVAMVVQYKTR